MPPGARKILSAIKSADWVVVVFWAFIVLVVAGNLFGYDDRSRIREGDECGPEHHWGYIRSGYDMELSCERDR